MSDYKELRAFAESTLNQTGPNVIGSASWFRNRATDHAQTILDLLDRLEAVTKARDTACDALESWVDGHYASGRAPLRERNEAVESITTLRKAGQP